MTDRNPVPDIALNASQLKLKLIADSGSTKTTWVITSGEEIMKEFTSTGFNAVVSPEEVIEETLRNEVSPHTDGLIFDEVHFYGAGCGDDITRSLMANLLRKHIDFRLIEVQSDLMAAARALLGHSAGIACILGTGSNSCLYNGREITEQVSPLGYILGDEGSGAVMGRKLVGDVLKKQLPEKICEAFAEEYRLTPADIIHRVYRQPGANRFLASFCPFLKVHIDCREIRELVVDSFREFFVRNVKAYSQRLPVSFIGSIALHFEPELQEAAKLEQLTLSTILPSPFPNLARYHN